MTLHGWQDVTARGHGFLGGISAANLAAYDHLSNSKHQFHLNGSHYFGVAKADSDTDFLAEYSEKIIEFLLKQGYVLVSKYDTESIGYTRAVYHHEGFNIDVQLTDQLAGKLFARDVIARHFVTEHQAMGKSSQRDVFWHRLVEIHMFVHAPEPDLDAWSF